ncbi:MAG TPA: hypothetical protein VL053_04985 [Arachidicoccus sp.]|nr:hypothetical protein [Arachidicoccus sp.]
MKNYLFLCLLLSGAPYLFAQQTAATGTGSDTLKYPETYWNTDTRLTPYRLPSAPVGYHPRYIDLDKDGDPDLLISMTKNDIPVMWIDDNDNMKTGDIEGDTNADCLLIDRNKDGHFGGIGDLVIDWVEDQGDGKGGMQLIQDYPPVEKNTVWPNGHYMWILDTDHDQVFNYIDWNTFELLSWEHSGAADFFPDYSGQSIFMKVHAASNRIKDMRLNWENPFLFYDQDQDGLSEMAVRIVDSTTYFDDTSKQINPQTIQFSGKANWVSVSVDMDNDNGPGNEFDFDMTLGLFGGGFDYMDQVHKLDMHSLPGTDSLFLDSRWRHLDKLIYADHKAALPLIFKRGNWNQAFFVYDEDDDCNRWERVEFLAPKDPFKIGSGNGGIDDNTQSDPAGDRGEWDLDNSGKGRLYLSKFDGRLHLYGADWGCWRIDQKATAFQGWDRRMMKREPEKFATVRYDDVDKNGFFDKISYDLDGDTIFEQVIDLKALGINDRNNLIDVSDYTYSDYRLLQDKMSDQLWQNAQTAVKVAVSYGLNVNWYAKLLKSRAIQEKYYNGYWLQFYLYKDLENLFLSRRDAAGLRKLNKAYFGADWKSLMLRNE